MTESGIVISSENYISGVEGFPLTSLNSVVRNSTNNLGLIKKATENGVTILHLGKFEVVPGDVFYSHSENLKLPVPELLLSRVVNPLGQAIDEREPIKEDGKTFDLVLNTVAPGINTREEVTEQLETGVMAVDSLLPIAKGQRQLIMGPPRSAKSYFLIECILEHMEKGGYAIMGFIMKTDSEVKQIIEQIKESGNSDKIIFVVGSLNDGSGLISLVPDTCLSLAESLRDQGENVLVVLDDMGKHAKVLRELGLLMNVMPGREAYPGDIFYQHAHLIERAGKFNKDFGGSSITLFPVIETEVESYIHLIPSNLMASTDGYLLFSQELRSKGYTPAIDFFISVTRLGKKTQNKIFAELSQMARSLFLEYREVLSFGIFASDLGEKTHQLINTGSKIDELFKQESQVRMTIHTQTLLLGFFFTEFCKAQSLDFIVKNKSKLISIFEGKTFLDLLKAPEISSSLELIKSINDKSPEISKLLETNK
ncbi:hypothetical protein A3A70_00935 [candidate division WWE3 bacterium RIFCSPLOWO2_01_FULL_42_11]|uniref:ATPase F1/V1/A1 complex alpha/beta subunit nucleotide-binding domain-containing protein n=1 Tax=candidate division WWE3 bacterium RIFCSPLOWO2_01_FULL_42_11 TaxID=1802627 RepID=A0A1F4VQH8_UNCKA|nr:MAG: hypothetical protein A3A70_00935 [candidate division WWE3 bacterium RIFCSPLOWO2_01_FULL_42_11]